MKTVTNIFVIVRLETIWRIVEFRSTNNLIDTRIRLFIPTKILKLEILM